MRRYASLGIKYGVICQLANRRYSTGLVSKRFGVSFIEKLCIHATCTGLLLVSSHTVFAKIKLDKLQFVMSALDI